MFDPKMRRRDFLRVSAVGAAAVMLGACAPKATATPAAQKPAQALPTSAPKAAAAAAKVRIFVGFGTGTGEDQVKVEEALSKEYNDSQTAIQAEWMITPWEEHVTKFQAMLAAGDPPDITMPIGIGGVAELYDENVWMDIQPLIERDKYDMSDFYGAVKTLHTYAKGTLGLPMAMYPSFIYYNADLFDKAGVAYPPHEFGTKDWTFDKLLATAQQITLDGAGKKASDPAFSADDIKQWGYDESGMDICGLARAFGYKQGGGTSTDYKTAMFNDPAMIARVQWISDSIWKSHIAASSEQSSVYSDVAGDPFASSLLGMYFCHSWMLGESYQQVKFKWDAGATPTGPDGEVSAPIDADTFAMPVAGKQHDAAWQVAKFFSSPGKLETIALCWGSIPARVSGQSIFLKSFKESYPNLDANVLFKAMDYADVPNHEAWVPQPAKVGDATTAAMDLIRTGENKDAAVGFENLNKTVQGYLDEYWKTH